MYLKTVSEQGRLRPLTLPPVYSSLHHTSYSLLLQPRLAVWLHLQVGWLAIPVLHRHPCVWPIVCKCDVIYKTRSTERIATPPEEDRAADNIVVSCIKYLAKIGRVVPEICSRTDKHTDRQANGHHSTSPAYRGGGGEVIGALSVRRSFACQHLPIQVRELTSAPAEGVVR